MEKMADLNETYKGIFLVTVGIILLLHTLGLVNWGLNIIILFVALTLIVYGAQLVFKQKSTQEVIKKLRTTIKKDKSKE